MEPRDRPRRLRQNRLVRKLVAETSLDPARMLQPYFVTDGQADSEPIKGMPGISRHSLPGLIAQLEDDIRLGITNIMLFGITERKSPGASSAYDDANPVIRAVKEIREKFGDRLLVAADVCLCAYTDSGHCGLIKNDKIDNDASVDLLSQMAVSLAGAGCDIVAPSDMMDGRVGAVRSALDETGAIDTIIMAYTAKYSSSYYGPFREAANSAPGRGDRSGYQMDFRNRGEALRELELDEVEGADIVMVKPALAYLDVISDFKRNSSLPIAAYNVSGEYAAVKLLAAEGLADESKLVVENLTSVTRAGASIILTYHLRDLLKNGWLDDKG